MTKLVVVSVTVALDCLLHLMLVSVVASADSGSVLGGTDRFNRILHRRTLTSVFDQQLDNQSKKTMAIANLLHVGGTACLLFITLWTKVESFPIISPKSRAHSTAASMFTGIIEEMGTVVSLDARDDMVLWDGSTGKGTELVLEADVVLDGAYLG